MNNENRFSLGRRPLTIDKEHIIDNTNKLSGIVLFAFIFSSFEVPALLGVNYPRMLPALALRFFSDPDLRSRSDGMAISLIITIIVLAVAAISLKMSDQNE